MPLYEYYCASCQSRFELLVSHQDADDVVCTKCHGDKVRRLLSMFAARRANDSTVAFDEKPPSTSGGGCCGGACGCH